MRITQRTLSNYRKEVDAQAELAGSYVESAIDAFYRTYPNADTAFARHTTIEIMKTALPNFCDSAGTLSADFFDEITEALGIKAESKLYETTDYTLIDQKVRYFAKFLNDGNTSRFKKEVNDVTRYFVKRSAYENMVKNCEGNQLRYARVPSGFETCAFCFMLASRGFVYTSERKAGEGHKYHRNCDCIVIPGAADADGNPRVTIDGYDPQKMYENWQKCAKTIGANPTSTSDAVRKEIMREVETRDWHWLYTGEAPAISFKPASLEDVVATRPHELDTAKMLSENGIRCEFVVDTRKWCDENGQEYSIGLPDLSGGIELKALLKAQGKGAVDGALRDAGGKEGLKICVIDNSWKRLDDDVVQTEIEDRMLRRHVRECLLIRSDGAMIRIKK